MNNSLFSNQDTLNIDIIAKTKVIIKTIEQSINKNEKLKQYYLIWKKVGNRFSDKDYSSSKQQAKKENPTEENLEKIYAVELVIALILRIMVSERFNYIHSIIPNGYFDIEEIFENMRKTNLYFLFQHDIYDIWKKSLLKGDFKKINNKIMQIFPSILENLKNVPSNKVFLLIHQNILSLEYRKLLGEVYTPLEVSYLISYWTLFFNDMSANERIIDLSCGAGVLLTEFIDFYKKNTKKLYNYEKIIGIDINPIAILISKVVLVFNQLDNLKSIENITEPLIFCADSLISLQKIKKELNSRQTQTSINKFFENSAGGGDAIKSENNYRFKLEFLGDIHDIEIKINKNNDLKQMRKLISNELEKEINNQNSIIKISQNLKSLIQTSFLMEYLNNLLLDRIVVFFALNKKYGLVLGNPPYLRVQSIQPLWKRDILKEKYKSAVGHFDIYYLFMELGIKLLKKNGILGHVTSNKFMNTSAGHAIRNIISKHSSIKCLIDFTDSHIFDAMVLPAIYILKKGSNENTFMYTSMKKVKSEPNEMLSVEELVKKLSDDSEINNKIWKINSKEPIIINRFITKQPKIEKGSWIFLNQKISNIIKMIEKNSPTTLDQNCNKIVVGIKTTANYAFIDDYNYDFINKKEIIQERSEIRNKYGVDIFFPLIKGKNIRNFKIKFKNSDHSGPYIFYPHYKKSDEISPILEEDMPIMIKYLRDKEYDKKLGRREYIRDAKKKWYEIWNTRDPNDLEKELKIVVPDISPKNNFAIDYEGRYVDGSAYFILLKDNSIENYRFILGLLNSFVVEFYYKLTSGNTLYARRYRYWSSNMKKIPIVSMSDCNNELRKNLIDIVIKLENDYSDEIEKEMNQLVFKIFNLNEDIQEFIYNWVMNNRKGK